MRHHYAHTLVWTPPDGSGSDPRSTLSPHVYEASSLAYRGLAVEGEDQSILVSGESGAGKTETVKIMLDDLASVQRSPDDGDQKQSPIVQRVLDSNPLLEAFGNAKTARNDNSSRFGKYIQLQFDAEDPVRAAYTGKSLPSCVLAGSKCEVYLLEKSRVCLHEPDNERTYHIFYQLLAAPEDVKCQFWEGLEDTDNESFAYVGYTDTDTIEGKTDAERFQYTVDSLKLVGVDGDKLRDLMRVICTVLQLGNIVFEEDPADHDKSVISSEEEIGELADLMGVSKDDLQAALTIRTIMARNEEFKVPLNETAAKESCDAFAKEVYAKTFLWLVRTINDATCAELNYDGDKRTGYGLIGLLDIFGFESFETNRFEQLCINYANEKLQQKFTQDIFRSVQQEYEYEGIELEEITYNDNTDVLDLVEGRMGLLAFLNEECVRPGGSDKGFVSKVHAMNKDNPCFIREKHFPECQFGVNHYAGQVVYDATAFVTKNTDMPSKDLTECALKSSNSIIANELTKHSMMNAETSRTETTKAKKKKRAPVKNASKSKPGLSKQANSTLVSDTVWTKFKNQLTTLMDNLKLTRTRYIRCIKPNKLKQPLIMQHNPTVEQLRCAGVVAAVTISRSAFPNRLEHEIVLDRFRPVWSHGEQQKANEAAAKTTPDERGKILAEALLSGALRPLESKNDDGKLIRGFVMGRTRAYFRSGALEFLENERLKRLGTWAAMLQKTVRGFVARSEYSKLRRMAIVEQSYVRMRIARQHYQRLRAASIVAQCAYRSVLASRLLSKLSRDDKATRIQTLWRKVSASSSFKKHINAVVQMQRIARGSIQRPKFRVALHERREEAKLENQVVALQRKLEEAERKRVEAEKLAEEKARKAVEEFREAKANEVVEEEEEKKESAAEEPAEVVPRPETSLDVSSLENHSQAHVVLSEQQQTLMDESGKMLEYLRKEVFKLRGQNAQLRTDFEQLKDNNQRLMDANASAGASFAALNQHTKQMARAKEKVEKQLETYKSQVSELSVVQVELREELKMKQATYIAEVHSRLQYQKALSKIVDIAQQRCRDTRFVESVLQIADSCDTEFTEAGAEGGQQFVTPPRNGATREKDSGLMSSIRSLWS